MEAKKHTQTEDSAVARLNGSQCLPCGMERDTLTLGDGMRQAIKRFASQNQGLEYEGREDLLQGYPSQPPRMMMAHHLAKHPTEASPLG